jgi:hypothetical protein
MTPTSDAGGASDIVVRSLSEWTVISEYAPTQHGGSVNRRLVVPSEHLPRQLFVV